MNTSTDSSWKPIEEALRPFGEQREFSAGSFVVLQGDQASSLFLLLSGSVAVVVEREESGEEMVMVNLFPGEIIGEMCLCPGFEQRSAHVLARGHVTVLEIHYQKFLDAASQHPELWLAIIRQLSDRLIEVTSRVGILGRQGTTQRIAFLLRELSEQPDAESTHRGLLLHTTPQELAGLADCSVEECSSSLKSIERAGLIEFEGERILVTPALQ